MHLLGALEESATKIFSQAVKPIKGLVSDVQEYERKWKSKSVEEGFNASSGVWVLHFAQLLDVCIFNDKKGPMLELHLPDERRGGERAHVLKKLPLYGAPVTEAVREGLVVGLRSAVPHADGTANWANLREVERWRFSSPEWETPFLPMDRNLSWRWVDGTGKRHPHLRKDLSRETAVVMKEPPCELDALFKPKGEWSKDTGPGTDADGWRYGLAWRSSTWDTKPGLVTLQKRKWLRTYT